MGHTPNVNDSQSRSRTSAGSRQSRSIERLRVGFGRQRPVPHGPVFEQPQKAWCTERKDNGSAAILCQTGLLHRRSLWNSSLQRFMGKRKHTAMGLAQAALVFLKLKSSFL